MSTSEKQQTFLLSKAASRLLYETIGIEAGDLDGNDLSECDRQTLSDLSNFLRQDGDPLIQISFPEVSTVQGEVTRGPESRDDMVEKVARQMCVNRGIDPDTFTMQAIPGAGGAMEFIGTTKRNWEDLVVPAIDFVDSFEILKKSRH